MGRTMIDAYARCSCGHTAAQHRRWEPPGPCRLCECDGFYRVMVGGRVITMLEAPPTARQQARRSRRLGDTGEQVYPTDPRGEQVWPS